MYYSSSLPIMSAERTLATQVSVVWHGFIIGCSTLLSALHKATMLNWWSHKMLVGHSMSCISAVYFAPMCNSNVTLILKSVSYF